MKQKEFSYGILIKVFGTFCCVIILLVFIIGPIYLYFNEPEKEGLFYASLGGAAFFIPVAILGIIDAFKTKLILTKSEIHYYSVLRKRSIKVKDLGSYEKDQNYFTIYSRKRGQKPIKLSTYFSGLDQIERWLKKRKTKDKDILDQEREYEELTKEYQHLSSDSKLVDQKLEEAKRMAKYMNIGLCVLAANILAPFTPYEISMIVGIIGGLLAILYVFRMNGFIKYTFFTKKEKIVSIYPILDLGCLHFHLLFPLK